jgi:AcrR family transcriptional regulator
MPAKTDRRHRQGQESRLRILEAALAIAAERGYDGTTVALVTERAGLPASSVYWQFKNKDDLLAEALDHSYRTWRLEGPTWQPANYTGSARQRIETRLRLSRQGVLKQPEYWRLGLMVSLLRPSSPIAARDRFVVVRGETRRIIEEWWRSVVPEQTAADPALAELLTRTYLAFVDGMFVANRADPDLDLEALTDVVGAAFADVVEGWGDGHRAPPRRAASRSRRAPVSDDDSRSRLLAAAAEIAAERGYRGTTISRVCTRAGVPVSSVYWYFADKEELFASVVQHSWDEWYAAQPQWNPPRPGETWGDALARILVAASRSLMGSPSFMRIGFMLTLEQQSTEVAARQQFLEVRAAIEQRIAAWFRDNLPQESVDRDAGLPMMLTRTMIAFTDGFFLASQIDATEASAPGFVALVVDVLEAMTTHVRKATA